jgi:hypothetical protein
VVTALHLDYVSCLLTIASTILVGRRKWQGWVVAAVNSVIISVIGLRTGQWGLVPANVFCLAIYAYNLSTWRSPAVPEEMHAGSDGPSSIASGWSPEVRSR